MTSYYNRQRHYLNCLDHVPRYGELPDSTSPISKRKPIDPKAMTLRHRDVKQDEDEDESLSEYP